MLCYVVLFGGLVVVGGPRLSFFLTIEARWWL